MLAGSVTLSEEERAALLRALETLDPVRIAPVIEELSSAHSGLADGLRSMTEAHRYTELRAHLISRKS